MPGYTDMRQCAMHKTGITPHLFQLLAENDIYLQKTKGRVISGSYTGNGWFMRTIVITPVSGMKIDAVVIIPDVPDTYASDTTWLGDNSMTIGVRGATRCTTTFRGNQNTPIVSGSLIAGYLSMEYADQGRIALHTFDSKPILNINNRVYNWFAVVSEE